MNSEYFECVECSAVTPKEQWGQFSKTTITCPQCGAVEDIVNAKQPEPEHDPVNNPSHYTSHPSGVECIQITEHMGFCTGNAMKYVWRADLKNGIEDLEKAKWYIDREIKKRKTQTT